MDELATKVEEYARGMISGIRSTLSKEPGLYYIGHVNGHNLDDLIAILNEVKSTKTIGTVLIHVVTEKGRGYPYSEKAADKYHGVAKFDPATGKQFKANAPTLSYIVFCGGFVIRPDPGPYLLELKNTLSTFPNNHSHA